MHSAARKKHISEVTDAFRLGAFMVGPPRTWKLAGGGKSRCSSGSAPFAIQSGNSSSAKTMGARNAPSQASSAHTLCQFSAKSSARTLRQLAPGITAVPPPGSSVAPSPSMVSRQQAKLFAQQCLRSCSETVKLNRAESNRLKAILPRPARKRPASNVAAINNAWSPATLESAAKFSCSINSFQLALCSAAIT